MTTAPEGAGQGATGLVLAGGRSTRFGRDKLSEPYRGMPLLHHVVIRLAEVCGEVVVVLAPDASEPSLPIGIPSRVTRDAAEGEGPLAGVHSGLGAVRTDHVLVAAGDMPDLQTPVLLELLRTAGEGQADAVVLRDGNGWRPLPAVIRRERADELAHALLHAGHRRLRDLFDAMRLAVIDEATWVPLDPERRTLFDVDEPADLER